MSKKEYIEIKGARVHNLKNISLKIPRDKIVVITGVSGSGKSSLAFDTIYAEGQRRYVESLSAYARQFLGLLQKPDVDHIEGLSPAISIEQRKSSKNPRSTVATTTEIYDYLRLLFARVGTPYCPNCGIELKKSTIDEIIDDILENHNGKRIMILAPLVRGRKGEYKSLFEKVLKKGYVRVRVDGSIYDVEQPPELERYKAHDIEILVDRIKVQSESRSRLTESVEQAMKEADGLVKILTEDGKEKTYSDKLMCPVCGFSLPEIEPRLFSFNSPYGACPACGGLGVKIEVSAEALIADPSLSILEGAIKVWGEPNPFLRKELLKLAERFGVDLNAPWKDLPHDFKRAVLFGENAGYIAFEPVAQYVWRRYKQTESEWMKNELEKFLVYRTCPVCGGSRLRKEALSIKIKGKNIHDVTKMNIKEAIEFFNSLEFEGRKKIIARQIVKEILRRLGFLRDIGVEYLTLDRATETLSAGEDQRVRLATQIGSGLVGVLYILDEPTIGLHPRDTRRLVNTLKKLRDQGNSVIVVEHDRETMENADWIVDLGPGAGYRGGKVVAEGTLQDILKHPKSITGKYLRGEKKIEIPKSRRKPDGRYLVVKGARHNNLKNIDVKIPLGLFVCVTGVSGSGKSSLIEDTLYHALVKRFYGAKVQVGEHDDIEGVEFIHKVINIDQSPIGRTPRSNPATYTSAFTAIRELFASLPEAKKRGYAPGRFSFNVKGGRCEACKGEGFIKVEMQFLPDVYVPCDVCKGKRFNRETLEVKYKGYSISDVLEMSVDDAYKLFKDIPPIERKLKLLKDVGLGYIKLGQPATTLSGGEAQRIKLARELSRVPRGNTLYILDEPTTGLHFEDVRKLIKVLRRLVDKGNTVLVIEHNLDVIKSADWVIDLGPEGGEEGGQIVVEGPPEKVARCKKSYTGKFLKEELSRG